MAGDRGRGNVEALEAGDELLDRDGVRLLVHAIDGRQTRRLEALRDPLVRRDHQLLDQAMRFGLDHVACREHLPTVIELELGLGGLHRQRAAVEPHPAEILGKRPRKRERLRDRGRRATRAAEEPVDLLVGEAHVGADQAPVERGLTHPPTFADRHLDRHRATRLPRNQRAGVAREGRRKHRLDQPGHVDAVAAQLGLRIGCRAGGDERRDVGDVHIEPQAVAFAFGRDRIVEIARARRVDREGGKRGQVAARARILSRPRGGRCRLFVDAPGKGSRVAAIDQQRLDHVTRHVRTTEGANHLRPAVPAETDEHQVSLADVAASPLVERHAAPPLEEGLDDREATAPLHDSHAAAVGAGARHQPRFTRPPRVVSARSSASSRRVAGSSFARTSGTIPFRLRFLPSGV